jgi:hypothetical protein
MTPPKKTEPNNDAPKTEGPSVMKKASAEITSEYHKVEGTIKKLPVNRRTIFFVGLAMVVLSFLSVFGQWVTALLGLLVMYFSFTGKNPLDEGKK